MKREPCQLRLLFSAGIVLPGLTPPGQPTAPVPSRSEEISDPARIPQRHEYDGESYAIRQHPVALPLVEYWIPTAITDLRLFGQQKWQNVDLPAFRLIVFGLCNASRRPGRDASPPERYKKDAQLALIEPGGAELNRGVPIRLPVLHVVDQKPCGLKRVYYFRAMLRQIL